MMRKPLLAAMLCALMAVLPAWAQTYKDSGGTVVPGVVPIPATVGGTASLAVTNASGTVAIPASDSLYPSINLTNSGSVALFYALGPTATTSSAYLGPGSSACIAAGSATTVAAITASSTTTLQLAQTNSCIYALNGGGGGGGGAVTSVSNSDSTLTISPTTGAVVASLNLGNPNTWTAAQTFPALTIYNNTSAAAILDIVGDGFNSSTRASTYGAVTTPFMELQRARGTFASPTAVQAGDVLGVFDYEGWDTAAFNVGAKINSIAEDTFTTSDHGSDLQFFTVADTTTTQSERMRILGNGNVGIGTTNPTFNLDVTGTERVTGAVTFGTSLALGGATIGSNAFAVTGLANFASVGSASAPALSVGNQTTGFYSVSTTGFGLAVNGVDKLDYGITNASAWTTTAI